MAQKKEKAASLFPDTYHEIILRQFKKRQDRNAAYTLTAFARDLDLSKTSLSLIMSGQQGLSIKKSAQVAEDLRLSKYERNIFLKLVIHKQSRSANVRQEAAEWLQREKNASLKNLQTFQFRVRWQHLAIRELIHLKNFSPDANWIAAQLDISKNNATQIWQECLKAGWIEADGEKWKASDYISLGTGQSNAMLREMHQEIIQKSARSLIEIPMEQRYTSFTMFSVSKNQLAEAKELIKNFRQQLAMTMHREDLDVKSEVLCFASQLFPITGTLAK